MAELRVKTQSGSAEEAHALREPRVTVGRGTQCQVQVLSPYVSREHFSLFERDERWELESLGINGTFVNGELMAPHTRQALRNGDVIMFGDCSSVFADERAEAGGETPDDLRARFFELEKAIHSALLARLDLRRFAIDERTVEENSDRIFGTLETIVGENLSGIDERLRRRIVHDAVKQELNGALLFSASETPIRKLLARRRSPQDLENEADLQELQRVLRARLGITGERAKMFAELELVDKNFSEEFTFERYKLTRSMGDYLIAKTLMRDTADLVFGLGPLQDLIDMANISEIMVVSKDLIYVERAGVLEKVDKSFISDNVVLSIIERIVTPLGRRIDKSTPLVDARLKDGSRVNAIIPPLALKGPAITIRKFSRTPLTIDDLVEHGSISSRAARFLRATVVGAKNVVISGGTGSGKTTLLNVLSSFIPHKCRIVTIEDSAELQLNQEHVVSLESRPPNIEGKGAYSIRDLVKNALRMRPDRIVVGECRGGETLDMLQAMNTGHNGSMTTGHANSPREMISRLETMTMMAGMDLPSRAIREQIVGAVHVIVQQSRLHTGERRVTEISEVMGIDEETGNVTLEPIFVYRFGEKGTAELLPTGFMPSFITDLLAQGIISIEEFF